VPEVADVYLDVTRHRVDTLRRGDGSEHEAQ
jgi:hypothetical protein